MQDFCGKMFENQSKLQGGDKRQYIKKQKSQNQQMGHFHHDNFSHPYLEIDLCDLFPVLCEHITCGNENFNLKFLLKKKPKMTFQFCIYLTSLYIERSVDLLLTFELMLYLP